MGRDFGEELPDQRRLVAELRRMRDESGLTLSALAAATHYSRSALGRWLAGERPVPSRAVVAMATACGRDPKPLLGLGREPANPADRPESAPVPRQLPASRRGFTARRSELSELTRLLGQRDAAPAGALVAVVEGTAGVGKTALAVHWAHQAADRFPDGQLFADLGGCAADGKAAEPAEVLRRFLAALGVPPDNCPAQLDELVAVYRSMLADRRLLVVLDNAHDSEQVRALLPGGRDCVTLVTSRSRLLDLVAIEGARPVSLDLLAPADARLLLAVVLGGERLAAEPEAVTELIEVCARLPLALCVAAARIASRPRAAIAQFVGELGRVHSRLDLLTLAGGAGDVRAVLSWSCQHLSADAARSLRLLGHGIGPQISLHGAASLTGLRTAATRRVLDELADANLLAEVAPGRFALHDLLRIFAREQCEAAERSGQEPGGSRAAVHRLLDHYLYSALAVARLCCPGQQRAPAHGGAQGPAPGVIIEDFADRRQAMRWCAAEHQELLAAVATALEQGFETHAGQLPFALAYYLDARGHWSDMLATQQTALTVACRGGDLAAQARAHRALGQAHACLGSADEGERHLNAALVLQRTLGDPLGEADLRMTLGWLLDHRGEHAAALECGRRAHELFTDAGLTREQAHALSLIGWAHARLGDHDQALDYSHRALALYRPLGDEASQASVHYILGYLDRRHGRFEQAVARYRTALELIDGGFDPLNQAEMLCALGDAHDQAGDGQQALQAWQQALAVFEELRHPQAQPLRAKIEGRGPALGRQ